METLDRWNLLVACPVADEALWQNHVTGFVAAFITPTKRQRWREQLTERPRRIGRHSHKMHSDLDRRVCENVGVRFPEGLLGEGLYYSFGDPPRIVPVELAANLTGVDAIYSLVPGKLAVYFFHEGEVWLCRKG